MKLRWKEYFVELAALLHQRTLEEGNAELVLKWGQSIFECLSRCVQFEGNFKLNDFVLTFISNIIVENI